MVSGHPCGLPLVSSATKPFLLQRCKPATFPIFRPGGRRALCAGGCPFSCPLLFLHGTLALELTKRVLPPSPDPCFLVSQQGGGSMEARFTRGKSALLERALVRPRTEVSLSAFALLFSELVQHCQSRVFSVAELQARLAALGRQVGARVLDALVAREKGARRETKVLGALLFVKGAVWKALFGKEADKLEQANDDARTFYIIEREPLINTYISVPKENSTLNCASFTAGIVEAVLTHSGFPAKVTAHWHKGTTLMIKFEEAVIARDRALEGR